MREGGREEKKVEVGSEKKMKGAGGERDKEEHFTPLIILVCGHPSLETSNECLWVHHTNTP